MRVATLPVPEIGLIAATRGMAGAGAALLLAGNLDEKKRKSIGWPLLAIGLLSTIPRAMHIVKSLRNSDDTSPSSPRIQGTDFKASSLP